MNTDTIHADGIRHSLAAACADTLKELAEKATPDAILGAVAHLPSSDAEKALYGALNALEGLKNISENVRHFRTLADASPETEGGGE